MDPHNDFDKHDRPPVDIASATNMAYADLKAERDGLLSLVEIWQEVDRDETPTAGRYRALTERRDTWLARHRAAQVRRCGAWYQVPQTSPPREEPFLVTYRCGLPDGHDGPHRGAP